jgi:hypothetical protein
VSVHALHVRGPGDLWDQLERAVQRGRGQELLRSALTLRQGYTGPSVFAIPNPQSPQSSTIITLS